MSEIKLDIIYANKATTCFGNRKSLSLINILQVLISIDTIKFYIINIYTLFFLDLKDIDIFSIYLNNITNQLIC